MVCAHLTPVPGYGVKLTQKTIAAWPVLYWCAPSPYLRVVLAFPFGQSVVSNREEHTYRRQTPSAFTLYAGLEGDVLVHGYQDNFQSMASVKGGIWNYGHDMVCVLCRLAVKYTSYR